MEREFAKWKNWLCIGIQNLEKIDLEKCKGASGSDMTLQICPDIISIANGSREGKHLLFP